MIKGVWSSYSFNIWWKSSWFKYHFRPYIYVLKFFILVPIFFIFIPVWYAPLIIFLFIGLNTRRITLSFNYNKSRCVLNSIIPQWSNISENKDNNNENISYNFNLLVILTVFLLLLSRSINNYTLLSVINYIYFLKK
jgi:hypothetical protein